MKSYNNILQFLLFVAFIFSTLFPARSQTSPLDSIINPTDAKMLLEYLASDSLKGRFTGTAEAAKAAAFISSQFRSAGTKPIEGNNGYLRAFVAAKDFNKYGVGYNVLSALKGKTKPNELIIFSAHYDHVGTFSTNPDKSTRHFKGSDSIYNGANDDASGVVAVILLARYFAAINNNERTLLFITFAGEELGLVGSEAISQVIQGDPIKALINIEMIGRSPGKKARPFITGNFLSNLKTSAK